jgi:putative ABC transport system ATP-binding protein
MALLTELNKKEGITLIVVTHSEEVARMARRVIRLEDGRIVEDRRSL